jgi:hypothetical protein
MTPNQLVDIVKDLSAHKPEVLEHLRVWAGLEKVFPCSDIEKEDAMRIAEGLGLITVTQTPVPTRYGLLAIEFSRSEMND